MITVSCNPSTAAFAAYKCQLAEIVAEALISYTLSAICFALTCQCIKLSVCANENTAVNKKKTGNKIFFMSAGYLLQLQIEGNFFWRQALTIVANHVFNSA